MIRFALTYVRSFIRREEGQDLIEYALLAALIAVGAVTILGTVSGDINGVFQSVVNSLPGGGGAAPAGGN